MTFGTFSFLIRSSNHSRRFQWVDEDEQNAPVEDFGGMGGMEGLGGMGGLGEDGGYGGLGKSRGNKPSDFNQTNDW